MSLVLGLGLMLAHVSTRTHTICLPCSDQLREQGYAASVEYVTRYELYEGVPQPAPAVLPPQFADNPHAYLRQLNHVRVPRAGAAACCVSRARGARGARMCMGACTGG